MHFFAFLMFARIVWFGGYGIPASVRNKNTNED
jgi:hypothetical protein